MYRMSRLNPLEWTVGVILTAMLTLEFWFVLAVSGTATPLAPGFMFLSLAVLIGVTLLATAQGWQWDGRGIAVALIAASIIVMAVGVAAVFFDNPPGPIVSFGFVLALAAGYVMWRVDKADRMAAPREEAIDTTAMRGRESVVAGDLANIDILRSLTDSERALVARIAHRTTVPEGAALAQARGASTTIFCILDGHAELHAGSALGQITVRVAGKGESFPLATLVGSQTVITDARAMTPMDVLEIPVDGLHALCGQHTEIGMKIYAAVAGILAERYRLTLDRLTGALRESLGRVNFWANV